MRHAPRATSRIRRRHGALALALVLLACLGSPAAALAHVRTGTIAVDYTATLVSPKTGAYSAEIAQSDHALRLSVAPGHVVTLLGYVAEPVVRLDAAGAWINAASPTAVAVGLLARAQAQVSSAPVWRLRSGEHSVTWRDARAQQLPAGVRSSHWSVALLVDGRSGALRGELRRYPAPSLMGWGLLLAALLAGGGALAILRHHRLARVASLSGAGLGALVCPILALSFALDVDATPGTWIEAFNEITFVGVGVVLLARGHEALRAAAAIGLGLVSLAVGLLDSAVFVHPIVLSLLPGALTRLLVVLAGAAGIVAIALGGVGYAYLLHAGLDGDLEGVHVT